MTSAENTPAEVRFERPEYIPMRFSISAPCWSYYPQDALTELMASLPLFFPGYKPAPEPVKPAIAPFRRAGAPYTDSWGCVWETPDDGITGAVRVRPLAHRAAFADFTPLDPAKHDGWGPIN